MSSTFYFLDLTRFAPVLSIALTSGAAAGEGTAVANGVTAFTGKYTGIAEAEAEAEVKETEGAVTESAPLGGVY